MGIRKGHSKIDRRNVEVTGGAAVRAAQIAQAVRATTGEAGLEQGKKAKRKLLGRTAP